MTSATTSGATTTSATTTRIPVGTYTSDPLHSLVGFRVKHFGISGLRGRFDEFQITFQAREDGSYELAGSVPVQAIQFPNEQLHGHLMSPDFFDAQLHPTLSFSSSDVTLVEDGTAIVRGELTMRGTSNPLELRGTWGGPVEDLGGAQRIALELEGDVDRFAYGISWAANLPGGNEVLGKVVRLEGEFELVLS